MSTASTTVASPTPPGLPPEGSPPARSKREIWTVMGGLLLCIMLAMLDNTIVGPALPTIVGDLGGLEHLSWVITGYTLAMAVTTLLWGKVGDLLGRKPALLASIATFVTGSALTGISESMVELIGFRVLQGIGAGGLMVGVLAIIGEMIAPRDRGRYTAAVGAVMPIAMIGGPLAGGWITEHLSWHWIFYINLPIGILAATVVTLTLHLPRRNRGPVHIDWLGAGILAAWASAAVLVANWAGTQYAWTSWQVIGLVVVAVTGLVAFIARERRENEPILPLGIFANRNFSLAGTLAFLTGTAIMGAATYLPQFQQLVQGMSATSSGLLLLPLMLAMMVTTVTVGQTISRIGKTRIFPILGGVFLVAGMALFTTIQVDTTTTVTGLMMIVLGIGIGFLIQPAQIIAQNSVRLQNMGAAMGATKFLQTMGMTIGTAIMGALYTSRLTDSLTSSLGAQGQHLTSGAAHIQPAMIPSLPAPVVDALHHAVTFGMHDIFWVGTAFAVMALAASLFIKEVPLRDTVDAETDDAE